MKRKRRRRCVSLTGRRRLELNAVVCKLPKPQESFDVDIRFSWLGQDPELVRDLEKKARRFGGVSVGSGMLLPTGIFDIDFEFKRYRVGSGAFLAYAMRRIPKDKLYDVSIVTHEWISYRYTRWQKPRKKAKK